MPSTEQANSELGQLAALIEGIDVAMLTTRAADGSLVSRPLQVLELDAEGELIFFTAANSAKVAELTEDSEVNLAFVDAPTRRFASVRGRARLDRDPDTIRRLWSFVQKVYFPGGKGDPQLMVLRIRIRDAAWWDAADNFATRALDVAKGLMSDEPANLGEHGHLRVRG